MKFSWFVFVLYFIMSLFRTMAVGGENFPKSIIMEANDLSNTNGNFKAFLHQREESQKDRCAIEYKITKKVIGKCIKLGKSAKACVAGKSMDLFNTDCM
ncbi:uncharacterized protein LOC108739526 [Agrilus planipennis]|uniref:Uncharacterized protein LOC108739526 n=1 Tax=Agrilus planipennis TaxID=224129 RepID=A0A1W4X9E5_AGRPL|nr:uncharacterized protein LOC108739526 [Agrilus planipennis]